MIPKDCWSPKNCDPWNFWLPIMFNSSVKSCGYNPRNLGTGTRSSQDCVPFPQSMGMIYVFGNLQTSTFLARYPFGLFLDFGSFPVLFARFFKNGPEKWFFSLFSNYMFLESWDQTGNESFEIFRIRGHLRSWEVIKGQIWKWTEPRHVITFWKA